MPSMIAEDLGRSRSIDEAVERAVVERVEEALEKLTEGREVMNTKEAADYLRMSLSAFSRIAPSLPRHQISPQVILYVRAEIMAWLLEQ